MMMMMIKEGGNSMGGGGVGKKQATAASPCAACKLLRRRCAQDCIFAPYFPADQPHKFATVHKVFGASNVNKMLQELPEQQRGDAVSSMVYEANARVRDPVYGCVGTISALQQQIDVLQKRLALAQAEVLCLQTRQPTDTLTKITTNSESPENGSSSPSKLLSSYSMDMVVDQQAVVGDSLWSSYYLP